jgi:class 3 adenylate cyclase
MPWNEAKSRQRINEHLNTVPEFDEAITLSRFSRMRADAQASGDMDRRPVSRAFPVEGAHLYGQLLDFNGLVAEADDRETVASHKYALTFLHAHYQMWDAIMEGEDADRVDYHGARLHAVVTQPDGDPRGQVARAVALAQKLGEASKRVAAVYGFPARIRFGIDHGQCLAMSTGRAHEKDTLFLGSPANHAAKLVAAADVEGIFLTDRAASCVGSSSVQTTTRGEHSPTRNFIQDALTRHPFANFEVAAQKAIADAAKRPEFNFHRHTPPLSGVRFADLSPSNSIRMGMASLFADIDGYTAFIDHAFASGGQSVMHAVKSIHVIREELNNVLRNDFGGKRVRFIGDCIHGVLAEDEAADDPETSVTEAALCASGMSNSFKLCQEIVGDLAALGLAIGIEYGPIPLTRLGARGSGSVRCASGRAMIVAEKEQQKIEGEGVRLGPVAYNLAKPTVKRHYASASRILDYDDAADLLGSVASPAVSIVREDRSARPYFCKD